MQAGDVHPVKRVKLQCGFCNGTVYWTALTIGIPSYTLVMWYKYNSKPTTVWIFIPEFLSPLKAASSLLESQSARPLSCIPAPTRSKEKYRAWPPNTSQSSIKSSVLSLANSLELSFIYQQVISPACSALVKSWSWQFNFPPEWNLLMMTHHCINEGWNQSRFFFQNGSYTLS